MLSTISTRITLALMFFLIEAAVTTAGPSTSYRERTRTYDVLHYALDIHIDDRQKTVGGTVAMRLVPTQELDDVELDAARMAIQSARVTDAAGQVVEATFDRRNEKLDVRLSRSLNPHDTITLTIAYSCAPGSGLYFVSPDSGYPNKPRQAWSQGEPEENHLWFPCYDYPNDKATSEMLVTVHEPLQVVSNGALLEVIDHPSDKTKTYHWYCAKPIASYQISVVAGEFEKVQERYKNIPVEYYVSPGRVDEACRSFSRTPDMMNFFSEMLRFDYPWPKYSQTAVTDFIWGGMENTSATTVTDKTLHSERARLDVSSDNLVAHELAHQWFGDLLTCSNWSHAWLNEGFATYCTNLWVEHDKGRDQFLFDMMETQQGVRSADQGPGRRPTVTNTYVEPADLFDSRIYGRGACILHMLRFTLGEDTFWNGLQQYVEVNQYRSVTTDDLQRAMEGASDQDLSWFFDQWVTKAGCPTLDVSSEYHADNRRIRLFVRQSQAVDDLTPLYRIPIDVAVDVPSGRQLHRILVDPKAEQIIDLPCDEHPLNVVMDPDSWVLKKLNHTKPLANWMYQFGHGGVAERRAALQALSGNMDSSGVRGALQNALAGDAFWGVRRDAVSALGQTIDENTLQLLEPAFKDSDARVRVAATGILRRVKTLDALMALGNIFETDSSYEVAAQAIGALVAIDSAHGMEYCERGLSIDSHNDGVRAAATRALGTLKTAEAKKRLLTLTAYGRSREVRIAAIDALASGWRNEADVRKRIEELATDKLHHVRRKALERLGAVGNSNSRDILQAVVEREPDALLRREARSALDALDKRTKRR